MHVTRPGVTGSRTENGVKHHLAGYDERDLAVVGGLRDDGLARTAVDIGREHGFEDGVVACDAALRLGASRADLWRALERDDVLAARHPGPRRASGSPTAGAQNVGESLLRLMVLELDIGLPETQYVVRRGLPLGRRSTCGSAGTCSSSTAGSSTSTASTAGSPTGR